MLSDCEALTRDVIAVFFDNEFWCKSFTTFLCQSMTKKSSEEFTGKVGKHQNV